MQGLDQWFEFAPRKSLIAVDAEPDVGPRRADRRDPLDVKGKVAGELDLDGARVGVAARAIGHRLGRIRADRERRQQRLERANASERPRRPGGARRLQFPQRAVNRIATAAGRHDRTQFFARHPAFDRVAGRLDVGQHMGQIIAQIIDAAAFPASDQPVVAECHDHNL